MRIANIVMAVVGTVALSGCVVETIDYSDAGYTSHPGYVRTYHSDAHVSHYHPRHGYQTRQRTYTSTASRGGYSSSGGTRVTRSNSGYSSTQTPAQPSGGYSSSASKSSGGYSSSQSKTTTSGYASSQTTSQPSASGYSSSQQAEMKKPRVSSEMSADVMKNGYYFAS